MTSTAVLAVGTAAAILAAILLFWAARTGHRENQDKFDDVEAGLKNEIVRVESGLTAKIDTEVGTLRTETREGFANLSDKLDELTGTSQQPRPGGRAGIVVHPDEPADPPPEVSVRTH